MRRSTDLLRRILEDLFEDEEALCDAVVRDGWPRPMVEAGFALHRETWSPEALARAVTAELADRPVAERRRILDAQPGRVVGHLWPSLPGAGVTPVLHGYALGIGRQLVKPSHAGEHFAEHFVQVWRRHDDSVELAVDEWRDADLVVVSGSDETVAALVAELGRERVIGYGHRVSFAVIVDDSAPEQWLDGLATDIVMWHQTGCFSVRGVVFVGTEARGRRFAAGLADAVSAAEQAYGATHLDEGVMAARMQRLGVAEFETEIWKSRVGWVELRNAVDGEWIAPHAVSFVIVDRLEEVDEVVTIEPAHRQGVAVGAVDVPAPEHLSAFRATLVCKPGDLQSPPVWWPHDGMENVTALIGPGVGRVTER